MCGAHVHDDTDTGDDEFERKRCRNRHFEDLHAQAVERPEHAATRAVLAKVRMSKFRRSADLHRFVEAYEQACDVLAALPVQPLMKSSIVMGMDPAGLARPECQKPAWGRLVRAFQRVLDVVAEK